MKTSTFLKPTAYLLIGVPGAGKSTWAEPLLAREFKHISSDAHIEALAATMGKTYGDIFKDTIGAATTWMNEQIDANLRLMNNLVWDQTNLTVKSRKSKLARLKAAGYEVIAVAFECPADELKRRRLERAAKTGKDIAPSIVESMTMQYVRPTLVEGFDQIIIVTPEGERVANE